MAQLLVALGGIAALSLMALGCGESGGGSSPTTGGAAGAAGSGGSVTGVDGGGGWVTGGTGTGGAAGSATDAGDAGDAADAADAADADPKPSGSTCADVLKNETSAKNGKYLVLPPGSSTPIEVYCDMQGGGWTLAFVSSKSLLGKAGLSVLYDGTGAGSFGSIASFYAVEQYGTAFHHSGIELRVTWKCEQNMGVLELTGGTALDGGTATWKDNRSKAELQASKGEYHTAFSDLVFNGTQCFVGPLSTDFIYGFAVGNGEGYGQYLGWYHQPTEQAWSTAVSDGAFDNLNGTVAGWFR
ncbi:MAG: hypothetical protein IPI67_30580 [Myxococcales bacterium]|nr:hypothetical protein [Myxococcales bacterium]